MWLKIEEPILQSRRLSGNEKIVLSYIALLTKQGKCMFASEEWALGNLGINDLNQVLTKLVSTGHVIQTMAGFKLTDASYQKLWGAL